MKNKNAPIALFCYKRRNTLVQTVEALKRNFLAPCSDLIIFSDGAKDLRDLQHVLDVRDFVKTINGFSSIEFNFSKENKGLANSIINGINQVFEKYESVIVVEDDLITNPNFLNFMNEALYLYENEPTVNAVCGYSFDLNKRNEDGAYFLNRPWPWTWATWRDRWLDIDWDLKDYKKFSKDRKRRKEFSKLGSDVNGMLKNQMNGKLDSWAIRWTFHQFRYQTLCVYPPVTLVRNIGFGIDATHTKGSKKRYDNALSEDYDANFRFPNSITVNPNDQSSFLKIMGIKARIRSKLETVLNKFKINY